MKVVCIMHKCQMVLDNQSHNTHVSRPFLFRFKFRYCCRLTQTSVKMICSSVCCCCCCCCVLAFASIECLHNLLSGLVHCPILTAP